MQSKLRRAIHYERKGNFHSCLPQWQVSRQLAGKRWLGNKEELIYGWNRRIICWKVSLMVYLNENNFSPYQGRLHFFFFNPRTSHVKARMDNPRGTGIISTKLPVRLYWTRKATNREPNRLHAFDNSDGNADKATTVTQNERMAEKKSQNLKEKGKYILN